MIKRIWGITFYVTDLKKATAFYEKLLALKKKYEYSSYVGFDCGGVEVGLIPKEANTHRREAAYVEFLVDDVDAAYRTLKEKGVKFIEPPHDEPWGGRQAAFSDLDGNILEIMQIDWQRYFNVATKGFKA